MYKVIKSTTDYYGNVIEIIRDDDVQFTLPFDAINAALKMRRLWVDGGKIRFLIDAQILSAKQMERWAYDEYRSLPKCEGCAAILDGSVYTNGLSGNFLFCSQSCCDKDYIYQMEILNEDEHEFEM